MENATTKGKGNLGKLVYKFPKCPKLTTDNKSLIDAAVNKRTKKFYTINMRTYASVDDVKTFCANVFESYAFCLHDRDTNADGSLKEPHIHIVGRAPSKDGIRITEIEKFVKTTDQSCFIQLPIDVKASVEYLEHKNDPDKARYPHDAVVEYTAPGARPLTKTKEEYQEEKNAVFISDLFTYSRYEMALKYGRDYMLNYEKYEKFLRQISMDDYRSMYDKETLSRDLETSTDWFEELESDAQLPILAKGI